MASTSFILCQVAGTYTKVAFLASNVFETMVVCSVVTLAQSMAMVTVMDGQAVPLRCLIDPIGSCHIFSLGPFLFSGSLL